MKIKKNLLLVITKVVIDIALCIVVISSGITMFTFIKQAQGERNHLSIPVQFKGATLEGYYPTHTVNDAEITMQAHLGSAIVLTFKPFVEIPMIAGYLLRSLLVIAILYNLRKIFTTFYHHQPFDYKNVTRIKIIALYLSLIWLLHLISDLILYSNFINYQLDAKFRYPWAFDIKGIIIAAIVYIVAEIFRYGFEIKKENEEFV